MKVRHNGSGSIQAVAVDSQDLGTVNVVSVTDNPDLIRNPSKYALVGGAVALRPSLVLTASAASAKADNSATITVSIQAKKADGTNDATATHAVALAALPTSPRVGAQASAITLSAQSLTLVGGVGSLTVKSSAPGKFAVIARADGAFGGAPSQLEFVA